MRAGFTVAVGILPGRSMSKPWCVCFTVDTLRPADRSNGSNSVSSVVLPLPDHPTRPIIFNRGPSGGRQSRRLLTLRQAPATRAGSVAQPGGEVIPAGPQRQSGGNPQHRLADHADRDERQMQQMGRGIAGQQRPQRTHLEAGLPLGQAGDRQADADTGEIFTQATDQDFAQHDDDRRVERPGGQASLAHQHHQRRTHQQLVGDRIEHAAEVRLLPPHAGESAVEVVGDGRAAEQHARGEVAGRIAQRNQHDQQRDRDDTRKRQQIRQVGQHRHHTTRSLWFRGGETARAG